MRTILLACTLVLCSLSMPLFVGCSTTPVQATIKSEGILIVSVDAGMNAWHDYVVDHLTDGKVTQKQIDIVKQAYNTYWNAQQVAKAAIKLALKDPTKQSDVDSANASLKTAEASLISILNQYLK